MRKKQSGTVSAFSCGCRFCPSDCHKGSCWPSTTLLKYGWVNVGGECPSSSSSPPPDRGYRWQREREDICSSLSYLSVFSLFTISHAHRVYILGAVFSSRTGSSCSELETLYFCWRSSQWKWRRTRRRRIIGGRLRVYGWRLHSSLAEVLLVSATPSFSARFASDFVRSTWIDRERAALTVIQWSTRPSGPCLLPLLHSACPSVPPTPLSSKHLGLYFPRWPHYFQLHRRLLERGACCAELIWGGMQSHNRRHEMYRSLSVNTGAIILAENCMLMLRAVLHFWLHKKSRNTYILAYRHWNKHILQPFCFRCLGYRHRPALRGGPGPCLPCQVVWLEHFRTCVCVIPPAEPVLHIKWQFHQNKSALGPIIKFNYSFLDPVARQLPYAPGLAGLLCLFAEHPPCF